MSIELVEAIQIILGSYLLLWVLQIIAWPVAKKLFEELPDEGWGTARFVGLVGVSLAIWETSHMGLAVNTKIGMVTGFLLLLLGGVLIIKKHGAKWIQPRKETIKVIVLQEYLFLVGFVGISVVRGFMPHLDSLEKFMDYGFIVSYIESASLPAIDMWQAGSFINYYSFGHFWASVLIRYLGVLPGVGYNLVLGFIAGVSLNLAFLACGVFQKKGGSLLGGFLGAVVVVFGGNSHTLWYFLKNFSLNGYWYADATRFIHNTIHEFPGYSLVVSDLHGHLFDLPTVLLFVVTLYLLSKKETLKNLVVLGGLFGVMMMTNTWDVPVYGLLLIVWITSKIITGSEKVGPLFAKMIVVFGVMALVSLPWWLSFTPISSGIKLVVTRSPVWQLGVLWGVAMAINFVAWLTAKGKGEVLLVRSLIITATLLILIPEIVYAKDIYPDHPRANTMFKLTYQSFIMSGIVFGYLIGKMVDNFKEKNSLGRILVGVLVFVAFISTVVFPTNAFPAFYDNFKTFYGLNGENWLRKKSPEKYEVIQFLKKNRDEKNMIEAVGDSYTERNVVSAYTGIPTIEGWRVHEWLWRGGYETVSRREQTVKEVYEGDNKTLVEKIVEEYKVGWILVGPDEGDAYLINHPKLKSLGDVVWSYGESYLIKTK